MPSVDALIFSKDRPAQLDLLLRSINLYAPNFYSSLTVLLDWSADCYKKGYRMLLKEHQEIKFDLEVDFMGEVIDWLMAAGDVISFLVDDDVFYSDAPSGELKLPLSLRGGDYDYPFSIDGNVYKRDTIINLLDGVGFGNPTELEHEGYLMLQRLPFTQVNPCHHPCLVGIPLNRVASASRMPSMNVHEYDLNEEYLKGYRLVIPTKPPDAEWGAHEQIELTWCQERKVA